MPGHVENGSVQLQGQARMDMSRKYIVDLLYQDIASLTSSLSRTRPSSLLGTPLITGPTSTLSNT